MIDNADAAADASIEHPEAELAHEIRRRRKAAGLSQNQLANRVRYSRAYVSRAERPNSGFTSATLIRAIDRVLQAGGALSVLHASLDEQRRTSRATPDGQAPRPVATTPYPQHGHRHPDLQEEMAMSGEEAARFVRRAGVSVTAELIEQLDGEVRRLATAYVRNPPFYLFRPMTELRRDVFDLLDRHPRVEFGRDLYGCGGRISALLAHASNDLGNAFAAESHARTAWLCADLAGDRRLGAYVRWVQANIAYWKGEYAEAADIARSGREAIADHPDDKMRLASQEARAHAAHLDDLAATAALDIATSLRESVAPATLEVAEGAFHFGSGKAAYYASEVRLALGGKRNAELAIHDAEDSLRLLAASGIHHSSCELSAAARLDLAAAHLASNDFDAAAEAVHPVLTIPSESRTIPIIGRIGSVKSTLSTMLPTSRRASELREQIALLQACPAAHELPDPVEPI